MEATDRFTSGVLAAINRRSTDRGELCMNLDKWALSSVPGESCPGFPRATAQQSPASMAPFLESEGGQQIQRFRPGPQLQGSPAKITGIITQTTTIFLCDLYKSVPYSKPLDHISLHPCAIGNAKPVYDTVHHYINTQAYSPREKT